MYFISDMYINKLILICKNIYLSKILSLKKNTWFTNKEHHYLVVYLRVKFHTSKSKIVDISVDKHITSCVAIT